MDGAEFALTNIILDHCGRHFQSRGLGVSRQLMGAHPYLVVDHGKRSVSITIDEGHIEIDCLALEHGSSEQTNAYPLADPDALAKVLTYVADFFG
jgi:hypothetical protein